MDIELKIAYKLECLKLAIKTLEANTAMPIRSNDVTATSEKYYHFLFEGIKQ